MEVHFPLHFTSENATIVPETSVLYTQVLFWKEWFKMFKKLIEILKANPRKIVFTEGTDPRILEASARLLSGTFLTPVLVGNEEEVRAAAEDAGFNIRGAIIVDPETYENMDAMVAKMVELRKGKMTEEECRAALKKGQLLRHHAGGHG